MPGGEELFLCLNCLPVPEGHPDVFHAVDGDEVCHTVESVEREFRQCVRHLLEGAEEVLDAGLLRLRVDKKKKDNIDKHNK